MENLIELIDVALEKVKMLEIENMLKFLLSSLVYWLSTK